MNKSTYIDSWFLMYSSFPDLNWARLRVFSFGEAEVFDSDGKTHRFVSRKEALNWLWEDEFTEFNKLNSEDESEYEINLSEIVPPEGESDEELKAKMYVAKIKT